MIVVILHFAHKNLYVYSVNDNQKDPDLLYGFKNSNLPFYTLSVVY